MNLLKNLTKTFLVSLLLCLPTVASAQYGITAKNLGGGLRSRTLYFLNPGDLYSCASASNCSPSTSGLTGGGTVVGGYGNSPRLGKYGIVAQRWCGNAATSCEMTRTSSTTTGGGSTSIRAEVGTVWPPAIVHFAFNDGAADTTPSCSTVEVWGQDPAGNDLYETLRTVNEAGVDTVNAYKEITRVKATTCTGIDADDSFFGQQTLKIALEGARISSIENEIERICTLSSSIERCLTGKQIKDLEGAYRTEFSAGYLLDSRSGTIDLRGVGRASDQTSLSPVDTDLELYGIPVWITYRLALGGR